MSPKRWLGVILVVAGVLGLAAGGFSYTKDETAAKIGPLELTVKENKTVNIPMWAGIGAVAAGALLLIMSKK